MKIERFVVNPFQENCYLLSDETGEALLIDPGCYYREERAAVQQHLADGGLHLRHMLCTHLHPDHILAAGCFERQYGVPVEAHEADAEWLQQAVYCSEQLGIPWDKAELGEPPVLKTFLNDGDVLHFGNHDLQVIHTPGHSRGSVCFYFPSEALLFSGDTLFEGSVGRTDFPGGSMAQLQQSLRERLFALPDEVKVCPGHGNPTSIGREKRSNPYA